MRLATATMTTAEEAKGNTTASPALSTRVDASRTRRLTRSISHRDRRPPGRLLAAT